MLRAISNEEEKGDVRQHGEKSPSRHNFRNPPANVAGTGTKNLAKGVPIIPPRQRVSQKTSENHNRSVLEAILNNMLEIVSNSICMKEV
jgi:hypothetical protein